jgi:hypothetical protein
MQLKMEKEIGILYDLAESLDEARFKEHRRARTARTRRETGNAIARIAAFATPMLDGWYNVSKTAFDRHRKSLSSKAIAERVGIDSEGRAVLTQRSPIRAPFHCAFSFILTYPISCGVTGAGCAVIRYYGPTVQSPLSDAMGKVIGSMNIANLLGFMSVSLIKYSGWFASASEHALRAWRWCCKLRRDP